MHSRLIEYVDYDGNLRKETFYFDLDKSEILEWEMGHSGGMSALLRRLSEGQDIPRIIGIFKGLIIKSIGEKSDDGREFRKSPEITARFMATRAWHDLYFQLSTNSEFAMEFIRAICPPEVNQPTEDVPVLGSEPTMG